MKYHVQFTVEDKWYVEVEADSSEHAKRMAAEIVVCERRGIEHNARVHRKNGEIVFIEAHEALKLRQ